MPMLKSLDDPNPLFFSPSFVLVVKHDGQILLLGPDLENFSEINTMQAIVYSFAEKLGENFTIRDLAQGLQQRMSFEPILLLKFCNELVQLGVLNFNKIDYEPRSYKLEFQFQDHSLTAKTLAHSVAEDWVKVLKYQLKNRKEIIQNGFFYGETFQTVDEIFAQIEKVLIRLDDIIKLDLDSQIEKTRESLWKIHKYFEKHSIESLGTKELKDKYANDFKLLNYYIHMAEDIIEGGLGGFIEVIFSSCFKPILLPKCDHLFSPDFEGKTIYLNYYEIGYSVIAAFEAQTTSKPVPQQHYSANHFIFLRPDNPLQEEKKENISAWAKDTHNIDIENPNYRLGHIPLAKLESDLSYEELCEILSENQTLLGIKIYD